MKKLLLSFVIFNLTLVIIANAAPLTGGAYTIPSLTISSGGSNNLTGGTYKMVDIKGQAVIGSSTGGTYGLGLGGIYGEVVAGGGEGPGGEVISWRTDPFVENLRIRKNGPDIVVEWNTTKPAGWTFRVFKRIGNFENAVANWQGESSTSGIPVVSTGSLVAYTDSGQVSAGDDQVYYRVLSSNTKSDLINMVSVGKVNANLQRYWNLLSIPFATSGRSVNEMLGGYFGLGDEAWFYDPITKFKTMNFNPSAGNWTDGNTNYISTGEAFWLFKNTMPTSGPETKLTTIGLVRSYHKKPISQYWNLAGCSLSKNFADLSSAGFAAPKPVTGDEIWKYISSFTTLSYGASAWTPDSSVEKTRGYWYFRNVATPFTWEATSDY